MSAELELLKDISDKLTQLLILTRLENSKAIADFKEEIDNDPILQTILKLADGILSSANIKQKVKEQTGESERTISRRIATLMEKGALIAIRKGKEIYYDNSGLYG